MAVVAAAEVRRRRSGKSNLTVPPPRNVANGEQPAFRDKSVKPLGYGIVTTRGVAQTKFVGRGDYHHSYFQEARIG